VPLTIHHIKAFERGATFVPNQPPNAASIQKDLERLRRSINLRLFWKDSHPGDHKNSLMSTVVKSTWQPPETLSTANPLWIDFSTSVKQAMARRNKCNLDHRALQAWRSLCHNRDIFVTHADKGGKLVIVKRADYIAEAHRQLNDVTTYRSITEDEANTLHNQLHQRKLDFIHRLLTANNITRSESSRLLSEKCVIPPIYFLPKIHKAKRQDTGTFPYRPIIGAVRNCLRSLDAYLAKLTSPLLKIIPGSLEDTADLIRAWEGAGSFPPNASLFSADVESLYPSIPWEEGLASACRFYAANFHILLREARDNNRLLPPRPTLFRDILRTILQNNIFHFRNEAWYIQLSGTAMGCSMSVYLACTFMFYRTRHLILHPPPELLFFKRYIDDIIGVTTLPPDQIPSLFGATPSITSPTSPSVVDQHIRLTFVTTDDAGELPALDLLLKIHEGRPSCRLYRKPTDGHQYLHWRSSHPIHQRTSIPYSQLIRTARNCTFAKDYGPAASALLDRFRTRDFPEPVLQSAIRKLGTRLQSTSRTALLQTSAKRPGPEIALITTFHPAADTAIRSAARTFWDRLRTDTTITALSTSVTSALPDRLHTVYRTGRRLGTLLGPIIKRGDL